MALDKLRKRIEALERVFPGRCNPVEDWIASLAAIIQKMDIKFVPDSVILRCFVARQTDEKRTLLQSGVKHRQQGRHYTAAERGAIDALIRQIEREFAVS